METYRAELHVHSVLSPCAEVEMIPPLIVQEALERGIHLLAITDHNATGNISSVMQAAQGTGLTILPGMELQTQEEVHLLCLFPGLEQTLCFQKIIDSRLPALRNQVDYFGEQFLVDATGDFLGREERLLLVSADISLDEAVREVNGLSGMAIPAHIDRKAFGLIANLGFIPPDLSVSALEVSRHLTPQEACRRYPEAANFAVLRGGDAHRLEELLGANLFSLRAPTLEEIRLALAGRDGRGYSVL
jgi:predicted metal-dependent phosphoesterase TrpH